MDFELIGGATPEAVLHEVEGTKRFRQCLEELPAAQGSAIHGRAFEEKDLGSIAKKLKTTANNVSVLLHRARTFLTSCIHEH